MNNIVEFLTQTSISTITVFVPIIIAAVTIFKTYVTNTKYAPIAAVVFGAILGYFFAGFTVPLNLLLGVIAGLTASGLYSGTKKITE